jgi:hypothetical protein
VRVFLDTDIPVSAILARGLSLDLFRLAPAKHQPLTGAVNLFELRRVLHSRFQVPATEIALTKRRRGRSKFGASSQPWSEHMF